MSRCPRDGTGPVSRWSRAGSWPAFPLLTTLALETSTSAHAAVVVGLLPLTTAAFATLRTGRRPSRAFWWAAVAGAAVVLTFAVQQSGGTLSSGDLYLFGALLVCAAGHTEGGRLAREMPGWQVIGWALIGCLPLSVAGAATALSFEPVHLSPHGVIGVVWVASVSTFFGLYVWYRGMASIGIARASQLQLAQPLLTLVWAVLLLGEHLPRRPSRQHSRSWSASPSPNARTPAVDHPPSRRPPPHPNSLDRLP